MEDIRKGFYTISTQAKKQERKPVSQIYKQTMSSLLTSPSFFLINLTLYRKDFRMEQRLYRLKAFPQLLRSIFPKKQFLSRFQKSLTFEQLVNLDNESLVQIIFYYTDEVENLEHYVMSLQQDLQDHVEDERPHNEFVSKEDTNNRYQEIECDIVRIYEQMGTDFLKYENTFQQITDIKRDKENQRDEKKQ